MVYMECCIDLEGAILPPLALVVRLTWPLKTIQPGRFFFFSRAPSANTMPVDVIFQINKSRMNGCQR